MMHVFLRQVSRESWPEYARTVADWIAAALSDGWALVSDENGRKKLERDGWKATTVEDEPKDDTGKGGCYSINVWGPDDLCVKPPEVYSWDLLQERLRWCSLCEAKEVDTVRYSFAGRCCLACRANPETGRKYEYPGWCD